MSMNAYSSDHPETRWWPPQQQQRQQQDPRQMELPKNPAWMSNSPSGSSDGALKFNLNYEDGSPVFNQMRRIRRGGEIEKEAMFEKPLTPSDVGKLNRLVIPKQHAEKHFPLSGESVEKGLLLSFVDESGRCWRFRYSYWNSSQSYVLTKGWSRYVKEKQLDAGDVVSFARDRSNPEQLFIGWRRRGAGGELASGRPGSSGSGAGGSAGDERWSRVAGSGYPYPSNHSHGPPVPYQADSIHAGSGVRQPTPVVNSKTLRLFGVNVECQPQESEPATPDDSLLRRQGHVSQQHRQHYQA